MMRSPNRKGARAAGFTLVEMLVVLALIGLVGGLSAQLLRPPPANLRVEAAARVLCATLRATRTRAIATNAEAAVTIDLARKTFYSPVGGEAALPDDATVEIDVASSQRQSSQLAGILFFPDGASTGGDVVIQLYGRRAKIDVNWLTGEAKCDLT
jgi:general secretion pathway protein H